jgi:hypothetical protein
MQENKKILYAKMPVVTYRPLHAALCLIGSQHADFKQWLLNNFIQIRGCFVMQGLVDLDSSPLVKRYTVPWTIINRDYEEFISFIENCINKDLYSYYSYDTFYNSSYTNYNQKHIKHELLIYGYDRNEKVFYAADFFDYSNYSFKMCRYEEVYKAFIEYENYFPHKDWDDMHLFKASKEQAVFSLDIVVSLLEDYLFSKNTYFRMDLMQTSRAHKLFGLNQVCRIKADLFNNRRLDPVEFAMLQIQKRIMCLRLDYMLSEGIITLEEHEKFSKYYKQLEKICTINLNLMLKYNMRGDDRSLSGIEQNMEKHIAMEKEVLPQLIECLKSKQHSS